MTGGEAIYEALLACGVEHVFGIPSVHNIPIYDVIHRRGGIEAIGVRHEQGALHAADGYARATGKMGVALVSTGPGTTNAMTGLYEAGFASSRVMAITGQADQVYLGKGKGFLHEAENQLEMLRTVTRMAEHVRRTEDIAETVVRVATDINTGRPQPGVIEIPINLQYAKAEVGVPHVESWPRIQPDQDSLAAAREAIGGGKKRVIWAGGGVINADASAELQQLSEVLNAPVFTSVNGRGAIPEDHPMAMGPLAIDPHLEPTLKEADVVIAVGTRFQAGATRNWMLDIPGKLVHIDADASVINRNYHADVAVVGDARLSLAGILRGLDAEAGPDSYASEATAARDEARAAIREQIGPDYESIMDSMRELLPHDGIIVRDATVPAYLWGNRIFPILEPRTSMNPTSAAIGPALPLAIGAAIGSGKKTAVIQGDGGFMLNIGELATAAQYNLPIVICVFNDKGYGVLRAIQGRTFEGRQTGVDLSTPDFAVVARGMGIASGTVSGVDEFKDAFALAIESDGPVLLDIDMSALRPMGGLGSPPPAAKRG